MTRVASFLMVAIVLAGAAACGRSQLVFDVTFTKGHGLQPGHPVVIGDGPAGEVVAVTPTPDGGVRATVRIDSKHRSAVYREASFVVENPGGFFDRGDKRQLRVRDRGTVRTPITRGDQIAGSEPLLNEALAGLGALGAKAMDAAKAWADRGAEFARQLPDSEDARQMKDALTQFSHELGSRAAEQADAFRREQLPAIKARADQYRRALERSGKAADAKRFSEQFDQWLSEQGR